MTKLHEQAVEMLQHIPDDKMVYIIDILKGVVGIFDKEPISSTSSTLSKIEAWEDFKRYKGIVQRDIDEKAELAKARDEKYANIV